MNIEIGTFFYVVLINLIKFDFEIKLYNNTYILSI